MKIKNASLPGRDPETRWDVTFEANTIVQIQPAEPPDASADPSPLLLPPLCHPHIHLDKAYLLTCNCKHHPAPNAEHNPPQHPDYSDLTPKDGTFAEALKFTSLAKERYTPDDLYLRGAQLLATSLSQGVTSCRAFVEIDHVTGTSCLQAAIRLKDCFRNKLHVQICAFAQDPIFSTEHGEENRRILQNALDVYGKEIDALGTTPYVEQSLEASMQNIQWAVETALGRGLHLDFHLDYNLDEEQKPMVDDVLRTLEDAKWNGRADPRKTIVLGHCTRLTLTSDQYLENLRTRLEHSKLPVHFVGLPTSDLFMMARPGDKSSSLPEHIYSGNRPRGTLQVLDIIRDHGLNCCLSVNNVGNAFTPWGTGDPLALASLGVGLYQAGTDDDANLLFACVSSLARKAIGLNAASVCEDNDSMQQSTQKEENNMAELHEGRKGEILLIKNKEYVACPGHLGVKIPAKQHVSVRDVVWDPPQANLRQIIRS